MPWQSTVSPPLRFTTASLPPPRRVAALGALKERGVVPIEPLPGCEPHVALSKWYLSQASLLSGSLAGVRQQGGPEMDETDDVFFGVNVAGGSLARQGRRELTVAAGDAVFLNLDAGPFALVRPEPVRFIGLRVARRAFVRAGGAVVEMPSLVVGNGNAALGLFVEYVTAVANDQVLGRPELARPVTSHLVELLGLALTSAPGAALPPRDVGVRAARLQTIKTDIEVHLTDPMLSVAGLAARHGVSPRYVHLLFEDDVLTCAQYILDRRLDCAYRLLCDERFADQTISSIAFDVGFGDVSYFNRAFRRHYGMTPSDARHRWRLSPR
jgi:AraC-like DNA-binding protein